MQALLSLLFPPLCLHCQEATRHLFCQACAPFLELIDPRERCRYCFAPAPCLPCRKKKVGNLRFAHTVEKSPQANTLLNSLRSGRMPHLAKTIASLMIIQLDRLKWQAPDVILGESLFKSLIAKELGKRLQTPYARLARRSQLIDQKILLVQGVLEVERARSLQKCYPEKIYTLALFNDTRQGPAPDRRERCQ